MVKLSLVYRRMQNDSLFSEFKPAIKFVLIFVTIYFSGNIFYGLWIEYWNPVADTMTQLVSRQIVTILRIANEPVSAFVNSGEPNVLIMRSDKMVLRIFEGCNGINVAVVFIAFMIAFGGKIKHLLIYITIGIVIIHLFNLLRIVMLYFTALHQPLFFYYFHKYVFTAFLYAIVFALWYIWTLRSVKIKKIAAAQN